MASKPDKIKELLERGVDKVIVKKDLEKLLKSGKKLRVYLGIDPTSTVIHLGNAVPLRKLRDFMELGHEVIFLVGSFTALIGDTSDKDSQRPALTIEQIKNNFKTYKQQAEKILDFSRAKIMYNGDWLSRLKFADIVRLAQNFTVQQMIERDMYQKRLKADKPIGLHEFLYPLMQGYDSVAMNVDVELGGSDQLFNMLSGRTLQKIYNHKDKHVLTTKLLLGTDGRKMSKTYGNTIAILDKPEDMYGKIMSLRDELIIDYFILATDTPLAKIRQIEKELASGANPRDAKALLAREITALYHSAGDGNKAEREFDKVFRAKGSPSDISKKKIENRKWKIDELLAVLKLASSRSEAKRLVEQGGVKINDQIVRDWQKKIRPESGMIVQVGKRRFVKIE